MFASPKALAVAAGLMAVMGLVPGMPHFSFLSMAALAAGGAYLFWKKQNVQKVQALQEVKRQQELLPSPARAMETKELGWDDVTPIDMIGLEVGYRLIPLVDRNQGGQLLARIKGVRKKLSQDLGFLMPTVHIRDNLDLAPSAYRLTLMGVILAEAEIYPTASWRSTLARSTAASTASPPRIRLLAWRRCGSKSVSGPRPSPSATPWWTPVPWWRPT